MQTKRGRKSVREMISDSNNALNFYAAISGKESVHNIEVPEKRAYKKHDKNTAPLEKEIQKAILKLLKHHPNVAIVWRQNSGTFVETDSYGNTRYIKAAGIAGIADIMGMLKNGRLLAIEVKRPGGSLKPHQKEFIDTINKHGGLGFMATSIDDVLSKININY